MPRSVFFLLLLFSTFFCFVLFFVLSSLKRLPSHHVSRTAAAGPWEQACPTSSAFWALPHQVQKLGGFILGLLGGSPILG